MIDNINIILASNSSARNSMLKNVGLNFSIIPANIDEKAIILENENAEIIAITKKLANQKALFISKTHKKSLVIGSDQTLEYQNKLILKSNNINEAKEKLKMLRGNTHILHSSVCIAHNEKIIFSYTESAKLTMHNFSDKLLNNYIKSDPDALTSCVGGYKIEGIGAWLFSSIDGDIFTIMGMPLLPLLGFLNNE